MTRKKKLKISDDVEVRYSNWMAQLIAVMMPWSLRGRDLQQVVSYTKIS